MARFPKHLKPHGHRRCGKGQYKDLACKAKSIQKSAIERGEATTAEQPYIKWLADTGQAVDYQGARRRGWR